MPKLPTRGERFAAAIDEAYTLNEAESILVEEIAAVLDVLETGGLSIGETRQQRILLSRLLGQLALPAGDEGAARPTVTHTKASRAARARWNREVVRDASAP